MQKGRIENQNSEDSSPGANQKTESKWYRIGNSHDDKSSRYAKKD